MEGSPACDDGNVAWSVAHYAGFGVLHVTPKERAKFPEVVAPYHVRCYVDRERGWNPPGRPVNGDAIWWIMILVAVVSGGFFGLNQSHPVIFLIFPFILPILRLMSWLLVERYVPFEKASGYSGR